MMQLIPRKRLASDLLDSEPTLGSYNGVTSDGVANVVGDISELIPDDASTDNKLATQADITSVEEEIEALGKPVQWKGPATVSELNDGITGIQPGWTYTLTDAGTLTDGSVAVDVGDEVAWTEDYEWFKLGGEGGVKVLHGSSNPGGTTYPDAEDVITAVEQNKDVIILWNQQGNLFIYSLVYVYGYGSSGDKAYHFRCLRDPNEQKTLSVSGGVSTWSRSTINSITLPGSIADLYSDASTYAVGDVVMYGGFRYVCNTAITTEENWTSAHWTQTSVSAQIGNIEAKIGSVKDGGALTSAASVDVPNNAVSTLSTSEAALTLNVNVGVNEVPNFAVEITAGANITLTVTKTVNNVATTLNYSAAAGNALESGKLYQVTCVGDCWTLAEFTAPTP